MDIINYLKKSSLVKNFVIFILISLFSLINFKIYTEFDYRADSGWGTPHGVEQRVRANSRTGTCVGRKHPEPRAASHDNLALKYPLAYSYY